MVVVHEVLQRMAKNNFLNDSGVPGPSFHHGMFCQDRRLTRFLMCSGQVPICYLPELAGLARVPLGS
jgi:hypothetical protein